MGRHFWPARKMVFQLEKYMRFKKKWGFSLVILERKSHFLVEKKGFCLGKRPRLSQKKSFVFGWNLTKFTQTYVCVYTIMIGNFSVKIAVLSISISMEKTNPASQTQLLSSSAKLSSCTKRFICLSRIQNLCTTVGLGPLPCLFCAIIDTCKMSTGLGCLWYIFFLNIREEAMAVKGLFGRQKCFFCYEACLFSGFWAFLLFSPVHL